MPDSPEGFQPPPPDEEDDDTITVQERPSISIEALKKKMDKAQPVNLDELLGKDRPKSGAKFSDTGEILEQTPTTPSPTKPQSDQ